MNLDKITVEDFVEFLELEEHERQNEAIINTVKKFIKMFLPKLYDDCPEFKEFCKKKYPEEFEDDK